MDNNKKNETYGGVGYTKEFISVAKIKNYNLAQAIKKMKSISSDIPLSHVQGPSSREASMIISIFKIIKHIDTPVLISEAVDD